MSETDTKTATCTHCGEQTEVDRSTSTLECDDCGETTRLMSDPR